MMGVRESIIYLAVACNGGFSDWTQKMGRGNQGKTCERFNSARVGFQRKKSNVATKSVMRPL